MNKQEKREKKTEKEKESGAGLRNRPVKAKKRCRGVSGHLETPFGAYDPPKRRSRRDLQDRPKIGGFNSH